MAATTIESKKAATKAALLPTAQCPTESVMRSLAPEDEVLLSRLLSEPADFVDHPDFSKPSTETKLYSCVAKLTGSSTRFTEQDEPVMDAVAAGERVPTLSHEDEIRLFSRYNYARYRVVKVLNKYAGKRLTASATRTLLAWGYRALVARAAVVRINLPLVIAMAKRTKLSHIDFNELISEGNMALLRSVEKFDCGRGYKFSTYSCRAILKSFSRVAMRTARYRGTFPTEFDPAMERSDFAETQRVDVEQDCVSEIKEIFLDNLAGLSDVEQTVIRERFALRPPITADKPMPKTLEQVGRIIGVTKERVRQIQNNALKKMRLALEDRYLAA